MAAILWLAHSATTAPYIGRFIYNYYFLSLVEGRLSVPAQIAGLEGFYDTEGRAFLYHGVGPLITRTLAWPFVDLAETDLRGPTIWLFAAIGSAAFYATALSFLGRVWPPGGGRAIAVLVWVMVWLLSPGLILTANGAFYHEPLAFAFAMAGIGMFCLWRLVESGFTRWRWLIALALAAALAVHGRPHVAVGLYGATGLCAVSMIWRMRAQALVPASVAMFILLASGLGYLQMNALRFGGATEITGTVSDEESPTVYGFLYWGWEPPDHPRFKSQESHGDFVAGRILPNLFLYSASMGGDGSVALYRRMTADMGHIRIEPPVFGIAMLWLPWMILAFSALFRRSGPRAFLLLGLVAALPAALVMLSYTTVTMRYRVELWPVLFIVGLFGLAGLLRSRNDDRAAIAGLVRSLGVATVAALGISLFNAYIYHDALNWDWGRALWSFDDCAKMVAEHPGLGPDRVASVCVLETPGS
ncbi:MAG: hypothetical protein HKN98_17185 [Silicimonas sp.]|nr:hypothetical protein [Silicimonas sp.]